MENLKLDGFLKEIERRIENELGMEEGRLVKTLLGADKDEVHWLIQYYTIQALKNHIERKEYFSSAIFELLINMVLTLRLTGQEKQPSPSETYMQYRERMERFLR